MKTLQAPSTKLTRDEERFVYVMQQLGDKTRYKIFKLLMERREMCVSEIASKVGISTSAVSQHFRNFEMIGLVGKERYGQKICYVLNEDDSLVNRLTCIAKEECN